MGRHDKGGRSRIDLAMDNLIREVTVYLANALKNPRDPHAVAPHDKKAIQNAEDVIAVALARAIESDSKCKKDVDDLRKALTGKSDALREDNQELANLFASHAATARDRLTEHVKPALENLGLGFTPERGDLVEKALNKIEGSIKRALVEGRKPGA